MTETKVTLTLEQTTADWIMSLAALSGKTLEKFIIDVVTKYQDPNIEPVQVRFGNEGFDKFWKEYPRKVGVAAARKAWGKIKHQENFIETILVALAMQRRVWAMGKKEFIPHPATWLNQERWKDERDEPIRAPIHMLVKPPEPEPIDIEANKLRIKELMASI